MIYIIGGPPKCGKTTLAKRLSKSTSIPWVSTDTLQNVIKPYVTSQEYASMFPTSAMQYENNDEKYTKLSSSEVIEAYRQQAMTLCPAIEAFVASEVADENDYILEGYHIEPSLINKLFLRFNGKVRGMIVVKKDASAFLDNITNSTTPNDWILTKTKDGASTFPKVATMVAEYSSQLENEAKQQNVEVLCVDKDFDRHIQEATTYLMT